MTAFPDFTLQTPRLLLRPLKSSDSPGVFEMFTDARFMEFVASPPFETIDQAHALIARDMQAMASGERIRFGIERIVDGALIGNCTLFNFDAESQQAGLGYGLFGDAFGKGYMGEALNTLLEYGFLELNLNRVHAEINPKNANSAKSLDRMGFEREGLLRENCVEQGVLSDTAIYGLLRRDWLRSR